MYASQTKRLCVRVAASDESRLQHNSTSSEANTRDNIHHLHTLSTPSLIIEHNRSSPPKSSIAVGGRGNGDSDAMTASALTMIQDENDASSALPSSGTSYHTCHRTNTTSTNNMTSTSNQQQGTEHDLINKLASETLEEAKLELLLSIRNAITACNRKKDSLVNNTNFNKIIGLIDDDKLGSAVKTQLVLLLCSVAKSSEHNVQVLNELSVDEKVLNLLVGFHQEALTEACLRCLRSIMSWTKVSKTWLIYENSNSGPENNGQVINSPSRQSNVQKIINYAQNSNSFVVQECIADIFGKTCCRGKDQAILHKASAISCIVRLIESRSDRVIITALNWLAQLCLRNDQLSLEIVGTSCPSGILVLDQLSVMMSKDKCYELQFLSARCYAYIYRALTSPILKNDSRIVNQVLPTLVRMVHREKPPHLRIKSAECIAYLIESDTRLQGSASVCDHLIDSLANMLDCEPSTSLSDSKHTSPTILPNSRKSSFPRDRESLAFSSSIHTCPPVLDMRPSQADSPIKTHEYNLELNQELKRASFLALAALASNLEVIRKKIFSTCSVMQYLVKSLTDNDPRTLKSVLTCLLSLSRSVQQLRTSFAENSVYSSLKSLLSTTSDETLILVLAILCNISLDFSPGKQHFLDSKTIDLLCNFTRVPDPVLKLHGVWILMNMVYQLEDPVLKIQILRSLGIDHLLALLEEDDEELVMKTLGFLRNLLSHQLQIDMIMDSHGERIMQSLMRIIAKQCSNRIKEQCLCVLTNIADGIQSKSFIMSNRIILDYLARTMCDDQTGDLRLAAICCITNLAHKEYDGSIQRRDEMKKFGIEEKLKFMLDTNDPILSDRVRTAYNQFLIGVEDNYIN